MSDATRSGAPLAPTAAPAIGDVLTVEGTPYTLTAILSAGRTSDTRYYKFTSPTGDTIHITPNKKETIS